MTNIRQMSKALVARSRGDLRQLTLIEGGRTLVAWCPDDEIFTLSRELVLDRVYERGEVVLRAGMGTVVDAGAHVGIFSLMASQWAERVVALEANELNFALLALNVKRNALSNVAPRHCALWGVSTDAVRFSTAHHTGGGVVTESPEVSASVSGVQGVSLDDLIAELGDVDLLKIDIEGAEYEVLGKCTRLGSISQIVGEMHVEDETERPRLDALVVQLRSAGFSVELVAESQLLSSSRVKRLWKNRGALKGHELLKAFVAAYYVAPVKKPIRPHGATYELPILIAHR